MRIVTMLVIASALLFDIHFLSEAHSSYNCGTGWTLYTVSGGIRCMKFVPAADGEAAGYVWYSEGTHPGGKYRSIGVVRAVATNRFRGTSADISGNGEDYSAVWDNMMQLDRSSTTTYPGSFSVAPWSETWTKASGTSTSSYTSPFTEPATECGPNFYSHANGSKLRKYKSYLFADDFRENRIGVRCVLGLTPGARDVWYGAGENRFRASIGTNWTPTPWEAPTEYAHLGARSGATSGQWDLCQGTDYCIMRDFGTVTVSTSKLADTGDGVYVRASNMIGELWIPSTKKHSFRVHPLVMSDTDGSRSTPVTANDVLQLIVRANAIYASSNIEFLFNKVVPFGAGGATTSIGDSTMNGYAQSGTKSGAGIHATFYGERYPADIVPIFTWGSASATGCPTDGGESGGDWSYISTVATHRGGTCGDKLLCSVFDDGQFAHEVGHYLGLGHTHANNDDENQSGWGFALVASAAWERAGCNANRFDGDNISTTAPDPFIASLGCQVGTPTLTLSTPVCGSKTFTLPRTNIMSYYGSPSFPFDKTITTGQRDVIESNLKTALRKRLE